MFDIISNIISYLFSIVRPRNELKQYLSSLHEISNKLLYNWDNNDLPQEFKSPFYNERANLNNMLQNQPIGITKKTTSKIHNIVETDIKTPSLSGNQNEDTTTKEEIIRYDGEKIYKHSMTLKPDDKYMEECTYAIDKIHELNNWVILRYNLGLFAYIVWEMPENIKKYILNILK